MARLTRNIICDAIAKKYNVERKFISMDRFEGTYHWCGEFSVLLGETEMNTHVVKLNDLTLERWLSDFDHRVRIEQDFNGILHNKDMNELNMIIKKVFNI